MNAKAEAELVDHDGGGGCGEIMTYIASDVLGEFQAGLRA
jgi:hypothetical protein